MAAPRATVGGLRLSGAAKVVVDLTQSDSESEDDSKVPDDDPSDDDNEDESEDEESDNAESVDSDGEDDDEDDEESESGSEDEDEEVEEDSKGNVDHSLDTTTFHDFPKLPNELKTHIFELSMSEPRFVRVDWSTDANFAELTVNCDHYYSKPFCQVKTPHPVELSICRDSRELSLKKYAKISMLTALSTPFYFDRDNDVLHFESNLIGLACEWNAPNSWMGVTSIKKVSVNPSYKKEKKDLKRVFGPDFPRTEDEKQGYREFHINTKALEDRVYATHRILKSFGYHLKTAIIASESPSIASKFAREIVNGVKDLDFMPRYTEFKYKLFWEYLSRDREAMDHEIGWEAQYDEVAYLEEIAELNAEGAAWMEEHGM